MRSCSHLPVSALKATKRSWSCPVWRSTPTSSSTFSASGEFHTPEKSTTPWLMLQPASSTHSTKAWRTRSTRRKTTNCGGQASCQTTSSSTQEWMRTPRTSHGSWSTTSQMVRNLRKSGRLTTSTTTPIAPFRDEDTSEPAFVLLPLVLAFYLVVSN